MVWLFYVFSVFNDVEKKKIVYVLSRFKFVTHRNFLRSFLATTSMHANLNLMLIFYGFFAGVVPAADPAPVGRLNAIAAVAAPLKSVFLDCAPPFEGPWPLALSE